MKNLRLILLYLSIVLSFSQLNAQVWQSTSGPAGGNIRCFLVSGSNVFAGTNQGVFLSSNGGATWTPVNTGLTNLVINTLVTNGINIYAGTEGAGVFTTVNNGTNWTQLSTTGILSLNVNTIIISGVNIYIGTDGGIYFSNNNGTTWADKNNGLTYNVGGTLYLRAIFNILISGTNIFAGTDNGVYLSTNSGGAWTPQNTGLAYTLNGAPAIRMIYSIVMNGSNLLAGSENGGVFLSTDNGVNWVPANSGLTNLYVNNLLYKGTNLFAATDGGIYISANNGTSWLPVNTGLTSLAAITLGANDSYLFSGFDGSGIFKSTNNGTLWTAANSGLSFLGITTLTQNGSNIYTASLGNGISYTIDNGANWVDLNLGLTNLNVNTVAFVGTDMYAGTYGSAGIYKSINSGASWTVASTSMTATSVNSITSIGSNIYAGTNGGIFKSINAGGTWIPKNNGLNFSVGGVSTVCTVNTILPNANTLIAGTNNGIYQSTDFGETWIVKNSGLTNGSGTPRNVKAIAVIGSNIFAGTTDGGVYLSTNAAASWAQVNTSLTSLNIKSLYVNGTNLFAATSNGVFVTTNNGTSWKVATADLANKDVNAILINSNYLFAATNGSSVWKSSLLPSKPTKPVGPVEFCKSTTTTSYSTQGATSLIEGATYVWAISPANAGTLISSVKSVTVNWSVSFSGAAQLSVKAHNEFGDGTSSDALSINLNPLPTVFNVTSSSSTYCKNSAGVSVKLSGSQSGIFYLLKKNNVAVLPYRDGTGAGLQWDNLVVGIYSVYALNNNTGCLAKMKDSVSITENVPPTLYNITASSLSYCSNSNGVSIKYSGSQTGVNYQLIKNAVAEGTPKAGNNSPLQWDNMKAGAYSIIATNNTTGCQIQTEGLFYISEYSAPSVYEISATATAYCASSTGVTLKLSGSQFGVKYQLKKNGSNEGTPKDGTGGQLAWDNMKAGVYKVTATLTDCFAEMTGTVTITENPVPTVYELSASATSYCSSVNGVTVQLSGSQTGIDYQLKKDVTNLGTPKAGTGSLLLWENMTAGSYMLYATNKITGCQSKMNNTIAVIENLSPTAYNLTSPATSYCSSTNGVSIKLSGSQTGGVSYQLKKNNTNEGTAKSGSGGVLTWDSQKAGVFTVIASLNTCQTAMNGSITITENPSPTAYALTTSATAYCAGDNGVILKLANSQSLVNYQLKKDNLNEGIVKQGTGTILQWENIKAGNFKVIATESDKGCQTEMTGKLTITENPLPAIYDLTSSINEYCAGADGAILKLSLSQSGMNYQLLKNGTAEGLVKSGTGTEISWINMKAGKFTVSSTNATTSCKVMMNGTPTIIENPLPEAYALNSASTSYCSNTSGVEIKLSNSQTGVNYQLRKNGTNEGIYVAGNGNWFTWKNMKAGTYSVQAYNPTTNCQSVMGNDLKIIENPAPSALILDGPATYCAGINGVEIKLSNSQSGVSYQLKKNDNNEGVLTPGTGQALSWKNMTTGIYKVNGININSSCTNMMNGEINVNEVQLPVIFNVTADPLSYCAGDNGVSVKLSGSQVNLDYRLYFNDAYNSSLSGTGASIKFDNKKAGKYKVTAFTKEGCQSNMNDGKLVEVIEKPLPKTDYTIDATPKPSYCANEDGVTIRLSGSESNVSYELKKDVQSWKKTGSGSALTWNNMKAGIYAVIATKDGCPARNNGELEIIENPIPGELKFTAAITTYCKGEKGVEIKLTGSEIDIKYQLMKDAAALEEKSGNSTWQNLLAGAYSMKARNTETGCIREWGNISVIENKLPNPEISETRNPICPNEEIICKNADTNWDYQWMFNDSKIGLNLEKVNPYKSGKYKLLATDKNTKCVNYSNILDLTVYDTLKPQVRQKWSDVLICKNVSSNYKTFQWFKEDKKIEGAVKQYYSEKPKLEGIYYQIEVKDKNGCIIRSEKFKTIEKANSVNLYPNPAFRLMNIDVLSESLGALSIRMYNSLGQQIYLKETDKNTTYYSTEMNVESLKSGLYYIEIKVGNVDKFFEKVFVNH